MKEGPLYRLALRLAPVFYRCVSGLLFGSCRVRQHGWHNYQPFLDAAMPCLFTGWHYTIFYNVFRAFMTYKRYGVPWVFMVSASRDAEFVASILKSMSFETARGSQGKKGHAALKKMIRLIRNGASAGIVADGSQGPSRQVQAGGILLAAKSGAPILPMAWAADRFFTFKSWDRTVLPKPFATISLHIGEPMSIPAKLSSKELEEYRLELQKRLDALYKDAWQEFGLQSHDGRPF
jgi:lysophospholipid acyltransferase (LPLAT)-like uncharacterized protein